MKVHAAPMKVHAAPMKVHAAPMKVHATPIKKRTPHLEVHTARHNADLRRRHADDPELGLDAQRAVLWHDEKVAIGVAKAAACHVLGGGVHVDGVALLRRSAAARSGRNVLAGGTMWSWCSRGVVAVVAVWTRCGRGGCGAAAVWSWWSW
eukprot:365037-Chlamydomonas_euryale.AAC.3